MQLHTDVLIKVCGKNQCNIPNKFSRLHKPMYYFKKHTVQSMIDVYARHKALLYTFTDWNKILHR